MSTSEDRSAAEDRSDHEKSAAHLYDGVRGQERAVAQLRAAARAPVHAYLFVGPPGSGKRAAAQAFAASLLCREDGCGVCRACTLALGLMSEKDIDPVRGSVSCHGQGAIGKWGNIRITRRPAA